MDGVTLELVQVLESAPAALGPLLLLVRWMRDPSCRELDHARELAFHSGLTVVECDPSMLEGMALRRPFDLVAGVGAARAPAARFAADHDVPFLQLPDVGTTAPDGLRSYGVTRAPVLALETAETRHVAIHELAIACPEGGRAHLDGASWPVSPGGTVHVSTDLWSGEVAWVAVEDAMVALDTSPGSNPVLCVDVATAEVRCDDVAIGPSTGPVTVRLPLRRRILTPH